ncbi:MAG: methionine adenosyltransferase [Planctomycetota bacterium]|nr:methionine adenosyltransferase [Planctomycetota bacterium]
MGFLFTSEAVTGGHPDKLADTISDSILDAYLTLDPAARVAVETYVTNGLCLVGGEVRSNAVVDVPTVAREAIRHIGYGDPRAGYPADDVAVMITLGRQSAEIAQGVDRGDPREQGAGDQGLMFGYACRDTDVLMPLPIHLSHVLTRGLWDLRREGTLDYLLPDAKSQVTVEYGADGRPQRLHTVVVSTQHAADVSQATIQADVRKHLFPRLPAALLDDATRLYVNPTGSFHIGGPKGDTGLTGRKIIVDTYGGWARHGGGAFSGKDPSKVDRSAAYMARYVAKNIVAAGLADACEIQLAYAIGVAQPVSIRIRGEGWGREAVPDAVLEQAVATVFDLTPHGIITGLDLCRPMYRDTACLGHFGRPGLPWEATDRVDALTAAVEAAGVACPKP